MLQRFIPCLWIGSTFPIVQFLGFENHISFSFAIATICSTIIQIGATLFSIFPLNAIVIYRYGWLFGKYLHVPQNTIFFSFLEDLESIVGPHNGHPTCPLMTHPTNNPYVEKSWMFWMHIAFKLNFAFKYASTFIDVQDSLLRMINVNIKKYFLITNQGGKL
jgi:hypothetical protein